MIKVKATREGLIGDVTSSGYVIDRVVRFVALPWTGALGWDVLVRNPANGKSCFAQVLDVGPHSDCDADYCETERFRPLAEQGISRMKGAQHDYHAGNAAGIDLSTAVLVALGLDPDNFGIGDVEWTRLYSDKRS